MLTFQLVVPGFDGLADAHGDGVIWIAAASEDDVVKVLQGAGIEVGVCPIDVGVNDPAVDFELPNDTYALPRLVQHMIENRPEFTSEDLELDAGELQNKYADDHSWGHHPVFTRESWREAVANEETIQGYWEWVSSQMQGWTLPEFLDLCGWRFSNDGGVVTFAAQSFREAEAIVRDNMPVFAWSKVEAVAPDA